MSEVTIRKETEGNIPVLGDGWHPIHRIKGFFQRHNPLKSKVKEGETTLASEPKESEFLPEIEIKETDTNYLLTADVPGIKKEDIDIRLDGNCLVIKGQRESEKEEKTDTYFYSERSFGSFTRSFLLPEKADNAHISAAMKDGVLSVNIPKKG